MFIVGLAAALFMLSAATGGSAADSCTSLAPIVIVVGGGDGCSASSGGEFVSPNVSALLRDAIRCMLPGRTRKYPANSCAELARQEPDISSGNYWILNSTQSPVQVFCEMGDVFPSSLNVTGGWVRVANLNMTDPNQQCPGNLRLSHTNPIRVCGRRRTGRGCDLVTFHTYGVQYQQVCGRIRGYQFASPDGFNDIDCRSCTNDIDTPYVDGVSITHGASPRKHIWTYAGDNCPCSGDVPPPSFVGSDYYCESGINSPGWSYILYSDDPLWDGQNCGHEGTCCDSPNLPWFCKKLPQSTNNTLELRICGDSSRSNEDTPIDIVQLYIQ